ncbi:hypothetical protein NE237_015857 [Protea cynaroides]|uniref:Beta-galactosidase n=1 Tax=Protea cynaroides TaxID=273540 RepID=A0A9Q0KF34_9MAGN|nr:hypothetical protein NE237_015857 [Protea cynaroides]
MTMSSSSCSSGWVVSVILLLPMVLSALGATVSYDTMWPDLIQKSKDGGLDVIETYVFWNLHESVRNQYDFEGRKDLVKFVKTVAEAGLYVHLRIGPYVCAEWNYGGFPLWLYFIPGIEFRTDNEPFKREMQRFTAKIVDMMKQENLYASQGGPIILSQIENEYGNIDKDYGSAAKSYISWAASMATSLDTGVPWVIPVEDLAFSVARFFQRGGTFQNYYMYHGGTNFGRTTGGPFIATSYDYDAPIDEYGVVRQPKWGHLKDLHKAIKLCEQALVATDPTFTSLGQNLEAHVYKTGSGICAAFLANVGTQSDATVNFNGNSYHLPAWSVSILPDCKNVVFNTAKANSQVVSPEFKHLPSKDIMDSLDTFQSGWSWVNEPVGISSSNPLIKSGLLEQINTTADSSDYLWYSLRTEIQGNEPFLQDGTQAILHVESLGYALYAFINGKLAGSGTGNSDSAKVTLEKPITLVQGRNTIDFLSLTVGLQNYGAFFDKKGAGITGPVKLGSKNGTSIDLSSSQWIYQIGLKGEELGLSSGTLSQWISQSSLPKNQPLIWYKTNFDAPNGNGPIALDFTGMGKGEAWVNGQSIGRYWPTFLSPKSGCTDSCNYRGSYSSNKCLKNCGASSQKLYHVPRSWVKPSGNILVIFEEMGGDPTNLSFVTRQTESLCSRVSESHPPPVDTWGLVQTTGKKSGPMLQLECPFPGQVISSIKFANFGTSYGICGSFKRGRCTSAKAVAIVQEACIGSKSCSLGVSVYTFGDPCVGRTKSLAVEATCS